jgi:predicted DNA-binding WGR domain protein
MKLIEQTCLWNREGSSDKVYEIDLCEVGSDRYVVNFRYGRRGATLKDGTKTTLPVSKADGQRIFAQLVNEKKKGGYQEASRFVAGQTPAPPVPPPAAGSTASPDKTAFVLACLRDAGPAPKKTKWPLIRVVWRAGELRIREAAPLLMPLLLKGDALQQYCACWALGRCGDPAAIPVLGQLAGAAATKEFVRRMALTSLLALEPDAARRREHAEGWLQHLEKSLERVSAKPGNEGALAGFWRRVAGPGTPEQPGQSADPVLEGLARDLRAAIMTGKPARVQAVLEPALGQVITYGILESMYLFAPDFPVLRPVVLAALATIPFQPGAFKTVRQVYKTAEFREDAEVFARLAYRLEKEKAYFRFGYDRQSNLYNTPAGHIANPAGELQKAQPRLAYSNLTAGYLRQRNWRTLRTLGEDAQPAYVRMAAAVLLAHSDARDSGAPRELQFDTSYYDGQTRQYVHQTRSTHFDTYADSLTFNHILYANSPRYEYKRNTRAWRCKDNYRPGDPAPGGREEAFPELWDKEPRALVQLLARSESGRVHEFALRALATRTDLKELVTFNDLTEMLATPYPGTVRFALDLVKHFYDPQRPDLDLLRLLIHNPVPEARQLVRGWIEAQPGYFLAKTLLFVDLVVNPYEDVWAWTRPLLAAAHWEGDGARVFIVRTVAQLLALPPGNAMAAAAAEGAAQTLTATLLPLLGELDLGVAQDLLRHPLPAVQSLGATILLHHRTPAEQLPPGVIAALIQSGVPAVRQSGVQLFGKLPESTLLASYALLSAFCLSLFPEVRQAVAPTVGRLAAAHPDFGRQLSSELLPYLQRKEAYEGLHADLYNLFTRFLPGPLAGIDLDTVLRLLHGNREAAQQLGLFVLANHVAPARLTVRQVVRIAGHEALAVRAFAWQFYESQVPRLRAEADEALRILDAPWDDSRQFAFRYFKEHFTDEDWTPDRLVSVCESTRPDVQAFGRELIMKFFRAEDGERYLLQLSQHPAGGVQLFATNYLEGFAAGRVEHIEQLQAYFVTILSQVNKAGVAKARIFRFLRAEALKHEKVAQFIADIMARQSVTMAVRDKAACIAIMRDLTRQYPALTVPLVLREYPTRLPESAAPLPAPADNG